MKSKIEEFLEYKKSRDNIAESTVESYKRALNQFFKRYSAINEHTLKEYYDYLGRTCSSIRTANFKMSVLNQYLRYIRGFKSGQITRKVCYNRREVYRSEDYNKILHYLFDTDPVMYLAVCLVANGLKLSEFKYIEYDHIRSGYIVLPCMQFHLLHYIHENLTDYVYSTFDRSDIESLRSMSKSTFYRKLKAVTTALNFSDTYVSAIALRDSQLIQDLVNVQNVCMLTDVCKKFRLSLGSLEPYIEEAKLRLQAKFN